MAKMFPMLLSATASGLIIVNVRFPVIFLFLEAQKYPFLRNNETVSLLLYLPQRILTFAAGFHLKIYRPDLQQILNQLNRFYALLCAKT